MRVAVVITSLGAGGTERSTAVMVPRLPAEGIEPVVICLEHRDVGDEAAVRASGVDVRVLRASGGRGRWRELHTLLDRLRPAVVHTAVFDADILGRLAAAGTGIPVLSSLVNTSYAPARLDDPRVRRSRLWLAQTADALTAAGAAAHFHAVSEGVAADAAKRLLISRSRITVVERGRDPAALGIRSDDRRRRARAGLGVDDATAVLLAVGRQEFQKGHVDLVAATRLLVERGVSDLVTLVAGRPGNASTELEAAIARAGVADRVRLLGHRDDVADLLAAADVFVMPSRYEGTAGAAIEALALEAPVVASRVQGTVGVLDDGVNARLVMPADPEALAAAVATVLDRPDETAAMTAAGRRTFLDRFTLDRSVPRMADLYRTVARLAARPPAFPVPAFLASTGAASSR